MFRRKVFLVGNTFAMTKVYLLETDDIFLNSLGIPNSSVVTCKKERKSKQKWNIG